MRLLSGDELRARLIIIFMASRSVLYLLDKSPHNPILSGLSIRSRLCANQMVQLQGQPMSKQLSKIESELMPDQPGKKNSWAVRLTNPRLVGIISPLFDRLVVLTIALFRSR